MLLHLELLPRRIANQNIKAAVAAKEDFRK
jgi:hypothetical protein